MLRLFVMQCVYPFNNENVDHLVSTVSEDEVLKNVADRMKRANLDSDIISKLARSWQTTVHQQIPTWHRIINLLFTTTAHLGTIIYLLWLKSSKECIERERVIYIFEIKPTLYIKIIIRIKKIKKFRHAVTRINNEETVNARLGFIWVKKTRSISFPWLVQQISNGCWDRLSCNHCRYRIFCYLPEAPWPPRCFLYCWHWTPNPRSWSYPSTCKPSW